MLCCAVDQISQDAKSATKQRDGGRQRCLSGVGPRAGHIGECEFGHRGQVPLIVATLFQIAVPIFAMLSAKFVVIRLVLVVIMTFAKIGHIDEVAERRVRFGTLRNRGECDSEQRPGIVEHDWCVR